MRKAEYDSDERSEKTSTKLGLRNGTGKWRLLCCGGRGRLFEDTSAPNESSVRPRRVDTGAVRCC